MAQHETDAHRRRFLGAAAAGFVAVPVAGLLGSSAVSAAEKPKLDTSNAQAKALQYVNDYTKVKDNPAHQKGAHCANCTHWQGGDKQWGGCAIFPNHRVHHDGWCAAWAQKA